METPDTDVIGSVGRWASETPEQVAYTDGKRSLSYKELNRQSDAVAAFLRSRISHEGPRPPVAIRGHKEPEMLIACIGILKAGHAYVPLDTLIPDERAAYMTEMSGAALTLTPTDVAGIVESDQPGEKIEYRAPRGDEPFYIMFTSGSTGRPKGVVVTAHNIQSFLHWMLDEQQFAPRTEIFLDQVSYSFDVSAMSVFPCLLKGGTLSSLSKNDIAEPARLYQRLAQSHVTTWISTPSLARMCLAEKTFGLPMLPQLKRFIFCGETLAPHIASELMDRFPGVEMWNTYGPTEATVAVSSVRVDGNLLEKYGRIPLGYSQPGTVRIMNDGVEVGDRENGEIVITGPQVSLGYLDNPTGNRAAFFETEGIRSYRTGDRGHTRDGLLFFEGRLDGQIKLHGYRIEIADIEANLRALPHVRDAIVTVVEEKGVPDSLAAFVILAPEHTRDAASVREVRTQLRTRLPAYMIPRTFRFVETFPVTPNGKADRAQLAALLSV